MSAVPLLDVRDLQQRYALPRESLFRPPGEVRALNGVSGSATMRAMVWRGSSEP